MQTNFNFAQLADPDVAASEKILRACVHCGFCTATCPTYVLLGDELDSPRGRIYLIKEMLEHDRPATAETTLHVDRCLSCLACMTTCPSGVHYMHLVDHARRHVEATYRRPLGDRALRAFLGWLLPRPLWFRRALRLGRPFRPLLARLPGRLGALGRLLPRTAPGPAPDGRGRILPAEGPRRRRVALLEGCVQTVLDPAIEAATIRLLARHGVEVVLAAGAGCCGSLAHHLGQDGRALAAARANIAAWERAIAAGGLDAIVVNASGCGTTVKDYGFMLRGDPAWAERAARVSGLAKDVAEFMAELGLRAPVAHPPLAVAYHSACSMQHGQQLHREPIALLRQAGFRVVEPAEAHLCCGSAGTYNILQPALATALGERKAAHLDATGADLVAAGNIGCIAQLALYAGRPVLHTVELLDWATGGPPPPALRTVRSPAP
jgi:glycolate dehydrogenase iron-sulfur subunit